MEAPDPGAVHRDIAASAGQLASSADRQLASADERTRLAADRTVLAAERTYAAWVRTGLTALAAGIGAKALLEHVVPAWMVGATGTLLLLFSAFCYLAAVWRELVGGRSTIPADTARMPPALLIGVNGFLALVSLAAVIGVWGR